MIQTVLEKDFHLGLASHILRTIHDLATHGANPMAITQAAQILNNDEGLLEKMEIAWTTKSFGDVIRHGEYPSQLSAFLPFQAPLPVNLRNNSRPWRPKDDPHLRTAQCKSKSASSHPSPFADSIL
jgi:hypothetical protein